MKQIIYHFRTRGTGPEGVHVAGIAEGFEAAGYAVTFVSPTGRDPRQHRGSNPFQQSKETISQKLSRKAPQLIFELGEIAYNRSALQKMRAVSEGCDWLYERYAFFCHAAHSIAPELKRPYALEVNELSGDDRVRPQVLTRLCAKNERRVLQGAHAVFPVSQYLADRIIRMGISARLVHVVPNGVDAAAFFERPMESRSGVRQRYGLSEADRLFVFVGWFVPWHQLERLLTAFAQNFSSRPECKLVLAGDGPLRQPLDRKSVV
jgi:glycosyltransferase involved in cell wall biosynthesis